MYMYNINFADELFQLSGQYIAGHKLLSYILFIISFLENTANHLIERSPNYILRYAFFYSRKSAAKTFINLIPVTSLLLETFLTLPYFKFSLTTFLLRANTC
jgi:hypothetical protein